VSLGPVEAAVGNGFGDQRPGPFDGVVPLLPRRVRVVIGRPRPVVLGGVAGIAAVQLPRERVRLDPGEVA
jgi:hypothetical protein